MGGNIQFTVNMDSIFDYSRAPIHFSNEKRTACFQDRAIENRIRVLTVMQSE